MASTRSVVPVVSDLAISNEGYIVTWSETFWQEGFCVYQGRAAFLSIGKSEGWASYGGLLRFVTGGAGVQVDRAGLEQYLSTDAVALGVEAIREGNGCQLPTLLTR